MTAKSRRRGHLPTPDGRRRLLLIRTVAVLALGATAVYLVWRATSTMNPDAWFLSIPMLAFFKDGQQKDTIVGVQSNDGCRSHWVPPQGW